MAVDEPVPAPGAVPDALTTIDSPNAPLAVFGSAIETSTEKRTTTGTLDEVEEWFSVGTLERPAFLMCAPFSHSVDQPNNIWMTEYQGDEGKLNRRRGLVQFLDLYNYFAADALVYLLPSRPRSGLQDEVFTANLAFVPEHLPARDLAIVSQFTSSPRRGETALGARFFEAMGYHTVVAPYRFEGEAEIKHLHDNVYIGGYGERTDPDVYDWMAEKFDMEIVRVAEVDPYLYHLDCSVFPLTSEETLVCTEKFTPTEVKAIEKVTGIVDVPEDAAFSGICNSLRFHNTILNASDIRDLKVGTEDYALEVAKNRLLEDICAERAFEPVFFNLSEYMKSGALLSCLVLHLNRFSYSFRLT